MSNILFTWELGGGMGHLMSIRPLAERLAHDGHRVTIALRSLEHAEQIFGQMNVSCVPAPHCQGRPSKSFKQPATFAHILHNMGFGDLTALTSLTTAWRNLYDRVQPELIVFDHSPSAMLAALDINVGKAILGTGFSCPAIVSPFPDWRPWLNTRPEQLVRDEAYVLHNMQRVSQTRLKQVSDLYRNVDRTLLVSYPELDPFGPRTDCEYLGSWPEMPGEAPTWPTTASPRVFLYVKPFPALPALLEVLVDRQFSTIVRMGTASPELRRRFECSTLRFAERFIDIDTTCAQCDVGIVNATHVMSASLLLAGKPLLMLPPFMEQRLTAERIRALGAGAIGNRNDVTQITPAFDMLLRQERFTTSAISFANRYASVDRVEQLNKATGWLRDLVN